ncbi:surface-associated interspersed protein (SURFIN), partial [Plasmodium relictum]
MQEERERIERKEKKRFRRSQDDKARWMSDFNIERDKLLEELRKNDNDENCKKFLDFLDCHREYLMVSSPNNPFGSNSTFTGDQIKLNEIKKLSNITNCYDSYKNNGTNIIMKWEQKFQQGKRKETMKFSRRNPKCESLYLWFISRKIDFYNIVKSMPLNYSEFWDHMKDEKLYEGGGQISDKIKRCVTSHFNTTEYNNIGNWMYTFGSEREIHNIKLKRGLINITEYDNWLNEKEKNFTNSQTWNVTDLKPFTDHWKSLRNETEEYRNSIIANHNCSLITNLNKAIITTQVTTDTLPSTGFSSVLNNAVTLNNSPTSATSVTITNTSTLSLQNTTDSVNISSTSPPLSLDTLTIMPHFPITMNSSAITGNSSKSALTPPVTNNSVVSTNSFHMQYDIINQSTPKYNTSSTMNTNISITSIAKAPTIIPSRNIVHDKYPGNILVLFCTSFGTILFGCTPIGSWIGRYKSKKRKKMKKIESQNTSTSIYPKRKSTKKTKHLASSYWTQSPSYEVTFENEKNVKEIKKYKEMELEGIRNDFVVKTEKNQIEEEENKEQYIKDKEKKKTDMKMEILIHRNENNNIESDASIKREMHKKKIFIEIYMTVLDECQREEWELYKEDFLKICLEEWKNDNTLYEDIILEENKVKNTEQGISSISFEGQKFLWNKYMKNNKKMLEKWKRDKWFKNLKKEWEKEQRDCRQITDGLELMEIEKGKKNMVEKQKIIWKHWLIKQRKWFMECNKEKWFNELLEEYEMEKGKYMKELPKENNEIMKNKKKKLIKKLWIEIHMMILEECKKEEWERNKEEFIKTSM